MGLRDNIKKSVVSNSMKGKSILLFGQSRTGKTSQAAKFPKPLIFAFENGLRSLNNVDYVPITRWSDFVSYLKDISNPKEQPAYLEEFETLVIDELSVACDMCSEYVCAKYGVDSISEGRKGYGLWKELDDEFSKQIRILMNLPFTIVIIGHDGEREFPNPTPNDKDGAKITKIYPAGIKRLVPFAVHQCDVIAYLKPNGLDANGREIPSSAIMAQTNDVYAGSRFTHLQPFIKVFSAEALTTAIKEAVEKEDGGTVTYEEQKKADEVAPLKNYDQLMMQIKEMAMKFKTADRMNEYVEVAEEYMGKGKGVKDATPEQTQLLELILLDLQRKF